MDDFLDFDFTSPVAPVTNESKKDEKKSNEIFDSSLDDTLNSLSFMPTGSNTGKDEVKKLNNQSSLISMDAGPAQVASSSSFSFPVTSSFSSSSSFVDTAPQGNDKNKRKSSDLSDTLSSLSFMTSSNKITGNQSTLSTSQRVARKEAEPNLLSFDSPPSSLSVPSTSSQSSSSSPTSASFFNSPVMEPQSVSDAMMIKCKLCSQMIDINEIENHSRECSAADLPSVSFFEEAKIIKESTTKDGKKAPPPLPSKVRKKGAQITFPTINVKNWLIRDARGIKLLVGEARKVKTGLTSSTLSFTVLCRSNLPSFRAKEWRVKRSWIDFQFLREKLIETIPFCIIPPLPEKLTTNDPEAEETQLIVRFLLKFLNRICCHPTLRSSLLFICFLQGTDEEWKEKKKEERKKEKTKGKKEETDESRELLESKKKFISFSNLFQSLYKTFFNKQQLLINANKHDQSLTESFTLLSSHYPSSSLSQSCSYLLSIDQSISKKERELLKQSAVLITEPFLYYELYTNSLIDLIDRCFDQINYVSYLEKKKSKASETSKEEEEKLDEEKKSRERMLSSVKTEIKIFESELVIDMKEVVDNYLLIGASNVHEINLDWFSAVKKIL